MDDVDEALAAVEAELKDVRAAIEEARRRLTPEGRAALARRAAEAEARAAALEDRVEDLESGTAPLRDRARALDEELAGLRR